MAGNKEGTILYKKVLKVIFTLLSIGMMLCGIVGLAVFSSDKYSQYEKNLLTSPDFLRVLSTNWFSCIFYSAT